MLVEQQFFVGDVGTKLIVEVIEDDAIVPIDSATTKKITIKRPDGTTVERDAAFETDGTDGLMTFITISSDFSIPGPYEIQGHIILPGWSGHTSIETFEVFENL